MLPLWIPKKEILDLENKFSTFIWHNKKPRTKIKMLQLPANQGGLVLSNLRFYNWPCHIGIIWEWLKSHLNSVTSIDEWFPTHFSPLCKLTSGTRKNPEVKDNPIIHNTIKAWQDIIKFAGKNAPAYGLIPLTKNEEFITGIVNLI